MLQQKFWRVSLAQLAISLLLEYVLVFLVVIALVQENVIFSSVVGLVLIYLFRAANGIMKAAISTVTYYLSKRRSVSSIVAQFYHYRLPIKNEIAFMGGYDYIQEVAKSKDIPEDLRRFLDRTLGELDGLRLAGALPFLRMNAILDAAVERYVAENNAHVGALKTS